MKSIWITYHMSKDNEVAETCIKLPMKEEIANDILENQGESRYVMQDSFSLTAVKMILDYLAELQGYSDAVFCMAEEAEQ